MVQSLIGCFNVTVNEAQQPSLHLVSVELFLVGWLYTALVALKTHDANPPYKFRAARPLVPARKGMSVTRVMLAAQASIPQGGL